jgi:lambda family phage minor tail protein L
MTVASPWTAGASKSVGNIVCPTNGVAGMFFRVTTAGTTGSSEPSWTNIIGESVYDNNIVYEAFSSIFDDLSKINPTSVIELFTLTLKTALHGDNTVYRFHSGTNQVNQNIVWAGNSYTRFPIVAEGFAFQRGQLPRPKLIVSNALGTISAILQSVNTTTAGNDLTGATVTRIRTLARFIDNGNFTGNNPFGTPDPNAEFPREIYSVDRKSAENREVVEFELAAVFDLAGIRVPKRQCTRDLFPAIGTFVQ